MILKKTSVSFSFNRSETFSLTISSNGFLIPCSLSSPSGTPMMQIFLCFILSQSCLKLSLSFQILPFISCQFAAFFYLVFQTAYFNPMLHPTYCLFLPVYSSCWMLYSSFLTGSFLYFVCPIFNVTVGLTKLFEHHNNH